MATGTSWTSRSSELFVAAVDVSDPIWQRFMAGRALTTLASELPRDLVDPLRSPYSWRDARYVLGPRCDLFRARILRDLASGR